MKRMLIINIAVFGALASFAQTDTVKIEQYCQVIAWPGLLSNKVSINIDFGEEKSFWREERLRTVDGKIKKFSTIIDALNYMGMDGCIFINAYPVTAGDNVTYHFAFKKLFSKSELLHP